jgi:hypothetical protein
LHPYILLLRTLRLKAHMFTSRKPDSLSTKQNRLKQKNCHICHICRGVALLRGAKVGILQPLAGEFIHASDSQFVGVEGDLKGHDD